MLSNLNSYVSHPLTKQQKNIFTRIVDGIFYAINTLHTPKGVFDRLVGNYISVLRRTTPPTMKSRVFLSSVGLIVSNPSIPKRKKNKVYVMPRTVFLPPRYELPPLPPIKTLTEEKVDQHLFFCHKLPSQKKSVFNKRHRRFSSPLKPPPSPLPPTSRRFARGGASNVCPVGENPTCSVPGK